MSRLQRICLGAILVEILVLQAAFAEVLNVYSPLHVEGRVALAFALLAFLALLGLVWEGDS